MLEYIKKKTRKKKIVVVGNPPYTEEDTGYGRSARPVYNIFIESLIASKQIDKFVLVVPARWFSGGGLDKFRKKMIQSKIIQYIRYFDNPHDVFPLIELRGGVCFICCSTHSKVNKTLIDIGAKEKKC